MRVFNLPTLLTLVRLIVSPVMLPLLLAYFLPWNYLWLNTVLAVLFGMLCLTDFFDGFLARRYKQVTALGKILDPIADKFLVYSSLIALLAVGKIRFYWVIILIGRELFVMGLRLVALEKGFDIPVSFWGKLKTVVQMAMLFVLIINPYQAAGVTHTWNLVSYAMIFAAVLLAIVSIRSYYQAFVYEFKKQHPHTSYASSTEDVVYEDVQE